MMPCSLPNQPPKKYRRSAFAATLAAVLALAAIAAACSSGSSESEIVIGGIPDQDVATLEERFESLADYLTRYFDDDANGNLPNIKFRYQPSKDYSAIVTAFSNEDVQLGWFGGLTGVQARNELPEAAAISQRLEDAEFQSVWIVRSDIEAESLADLQGRSFTFGSEISTSGRLMPQYFLQQQELSIDQLFSDYSFSGSHDRTWQLVEAGTYDAGVLNKSVWDSAVADGRVDLDEVSVLEVSQPYFDYHWLAHPDIDETHGAGTTGHIMQALLDLDEETGNPLAQMVLDSFLTGEFIPTENSNYDQIETIAKELGLLI